MSVTQLNSTAQGSHAFAASVLIFDDGYVDRLNPITLCRPAHAIACGGYRLTDVVERLGLSTLVVSLDDALVGDRWEDLEHHVADRTAGPLRVFMNSCLVPDVQLAKTVDELLRHRAVGAVWDKDRLALAIFPTPQQVPFQVERDGAERDGAERDGASLNVGTPNGGGRLPFSITDYVRRAKLPPLTLPTGLRSHVSLLHYPHSVIAAHQRIFASNLADRIDGDDFREVSPGVFLQEGATLGEYVVCDTTRGPIVCEAGAVVGPFSLLEGPLLIAPNATVHARTTVHPFVWLGQRSKIGGEVEASIIEAYSNKQHHGYLGHSYVGRWVNLGAGTSNSNLKNTYGQVNMTVDGQKIATGMRLMGCVIGDFTKSAINTSILTGRRIGVASMLYGLVAQDVPSFVNYAHQFGDVTAVSFESVVTTQRRMFDRRDVVFQSSDEQLLARIHKRTEPERVGLECRPPRL